MVRRRPKVLIVCMAAASLGGSLAVGVVASWSQAHELKTGAGASWRVRASLNVLWNTVFRRTAVLNSRKRPILLAILLSGAFFAGADRVVIAGGPGSPPAASGTAPSGAPLAYDTFAVVASKDLEAAGLTDLLTAQLSQIAGLRLVERQQVRALAGELELAAMLGTEGAAGRLKAGRLLGAQALVLLSLERSDPAQGVANQLRLVISEGRCGARLYAERVAWEPGKADAIAAGVASAVARVRLQFPQGVRRVIAVPPFVCRDFTHEQDRLQAVFASLLQSGLETTPGVAVLEVEEARALRQEHEVATPALSGGTPHVEPPLFVEGEYVSQRTAAGEVTFSITAKFGADGKTPASSRVIERKSLNAAAAATFLSHDLPALVLLDDPTRHAPAQSSTAPDMFHELAARAAVFASLGAFDHAIKLREAALLMMPGDVQQRRFLVDEYLWLGYARMFSQDARLSIAERHAQRCSIFSIGVEHLEFLIRHRAMGRSEAVSLAADYRHAFFYPGAEDSPQLRSFLRDVYPSLLDLDGPRDDATWDRDRRRWLSGFVPKQAGFEMMIFDCANRTTPEGFDFLAELIEKYFPDDLPPPAEVVSLFRAIPPEKLRPGPGSIAEPVRWEAAYFHFLDRMEKCPKKIYSVCARYGRLYYEMQRGSKTPSQVLPQADTLLADYKNLNLIWMPPVERTPLAGAISELRRKSGAPRVPILVNSSTAAASGAPLRRPTLISGIATDLIVAGAARPATQPLSGAVRFEQIDLRVKSWRGDVVPFGTDENPNFPSDVRLPNHILSCGSDLDVMWDSRSVWFLRTGGLLEETRGGNESPASFSDVQWDGHSIWVASTSDGMEVLDPSGRTLVSIGREDGLPADGCLLIHPLSPGRVLVAGSFGMEARGWCGLIEFDEARKSAKVNIFHRASTAAPLGISRTLLSNSVPAPADAGFTPRRIIDFPGNRGTAPQDAATSARFVLVYRSGLRPGLSQFPLVIDTATLKVSVAQTALASEKAYGGHGLLMYGDALFEADQTGIVRYPRSLFATAPGSTQPVAPGRPALIYAAAQDERLAADRLGDVIFQDFAYLPGPTWQKLDLRTSTVELFASDRPEPRAASPLPDLHFGVSSQYGLVFWDTRFCRVSFEKGAVLPPDAGRSDAAAVSRQRRAAIRAAPRRPSATLSAERPVGPRPFGKLSLDETVSRLTSQSPWAVRDALQRLAAMPAATDGAVRDRVAVAIVTTANGGEAFKRAIQIWHTPACVGPLIERLKSADFRTSMAAGMALQDAQEPAAEEAALAGIGADGEPALIRYLQRSHFVLQLAACKALQQVGTSNCVPELRAQATRGNDLRIRAAAQAALNAIAAREQKRVQK